MMAEPDDDPLVPLQDSLRDVIRSLRPGDEAGTDIAALGGIFERWDDAVGPAIAARVRPVRLDGTRLLVEVHDPAWAVQVKFFTEMIIQRLEEVAHARVDTLAVRVV